MPTSAAGFGAIFNYLVKYLNMWVLLNDILLVRGGILIFIDCDVAQAPRMAAKQDDASVLETGCEHVSMKQVDRRQRHWYKYGRGAYIRESLDE